MIGDRGERRGNATQATDGTVQLASPTPPPRRTPPIIQALVDWYARGFIGRFVGLYGAAQAGSLATLLAYHMFFSMFPIALAMVTALGFVLRDDRLLAQVQAALVLALPSDPGLVESLEATLLGARQSAGWLGLVSLLGLLWSGSALFAVMEQAFDVIFVTPARPFWASRLLAVGMIGLFAVLLVTSLFAASLPALIINAWANLALWLQIDQPIAIGGAQVLLGWVASLGSAFVLFFALYWLVPNRRLPIGQIWPGALLAAGLFVLVSQMFPLYAATFGNFNRYGASFGLAFLLLTWFSFVGQIIVVGAIVNATLAPAPASGARTSSAIRR